MLLILQNIKYVNIFPLPMIICARATNACLVQPIRSIDEINCMHFVKRALRPSFQFEQIL